ncbi:hypothetical protein [Epilithonimonas sp.]|uniref:hypothetical protein n=1 Tax=Epilithonimonas sp. TaxID=2894511 RepID=UPI00289DA332|nr:hypothetical protein [Epilithonimonas sp.]
MIKIITTIIAIYLLYYTGNIIYDLFLKRDNSGKQDESEEYSLTEFSEKIKTEVKEVGIDDVENINTPNSFSRKELFPFNQDDQHELRNLDYWRNKFELEQDIDSFDNQPEIRDKQEKENLDFDSEEKNTEVISFPKNDSFSKQFKNFLNLAETNVQVLSERDGYKVYQSMI